MTGPARRRLDLVTSRHRNVALPPIIVWRQGGGVASMVWNWTVRLALPLLLGVLAAALHVMWSEAPYAPGLLDILGTIGIIVTMLGIVVWCVCAWLGSEGDPPTRSELSPR
jgi:hypothetical protein